MPTIFELNTRDSKPAFVPGSHRFRMFIPFPPAGQQLNIVMPLEPPKINNRKPALSQRRAVHTSHMAPETEYVYSYIYVMIMSHI